ncbi:Vacuolar ATP synthase subunit H [Giardia duodenalis]|uniref:Vacuolar ATP synthase subunit H n=1 Tax=Giardia intestinalis TaxID=5741 RepID=V6TA65_GIAIN|nr:Vacuolar ATP synthase subunit H [Giardia intestinalis]
MKNFLPHREIFGLFNFEISMSPLDAFEVVLRLNDLTHFAPKSTGSVCKLMWSDYTERGKLFSEAAVTTKDELISFSLSFLHNPASSSSALLAAVLFRLSDFCQWCSDFEQRLITRLDPQLFNQLVASFEKERNLNRHVLYYERGDETFSYTPLASGENPISHKFTTGCYLCALDTLLAQLAHSVTVSMPLFFSVCRTADRLMDIIANFKLVYTPLIEKSLPFLAKLMMNPVLFAFILTAETFDHGSVDRAYMDQYADDYYNAHADSMITGLSGEQEHQTLSPGSPRTVAGSKLLPLFINMIVSHLPRVSNQKSVEFPIIYGCLLCIWLSSFVEKRSLLTQGIFVLVVRILNCTILQNVAKIVRLSLKILLNVSTLPEAVDFMAASQLDAVLVVMESKGWQESKENPSGCIYTLLRELRAILEQTIKKVTTWETYLAELKSDLLGNTPVHTSEAFWKANSHRLLDNSAYALNRLEQIGTKAYKSDTNSLLVCLNDIGMFCISYSNGKNVVAQMPNIKAFVMSCLQHEAETVRDAAIVTLSKVLVDNWRNV